MYRPKGWDEIKKGIANEKWMLPPQNEFPIVIPGGMEFNIMKNNLIEAGADAYEEGLKKQGEYIPRKWADDAFGLHTTGGGYLVFIPEEG